MDRDAVRWMRCTARLKEARSDVAAGWVVSRKGLLLAGCCSTSSSAAPLLPAAVAPTATRCDFGAMASRTSASLPTSSLNGDGIQRRSLEQL